MRGFFVIQPKELLCNLMGVLQLENASAINQNEKIGEDHEKDHVDFNNGGCCYSLR